MMMLLLLLDEPVVVLSAVWALTLLALFLALDFLFHKVLLLPRPNLVDAFCTGRYTFYYLHDLAQNR